MLKAKSGPAARRHPPSVRPGIEQLETRLVPTVSINLVNGQLLVSGAADAANHTIILDHTGLNNGSGKTLVSADGGLFRSFADASITAGISIDAGVAAGTVFVRAAVKPTSVVGDSGGDFFSLGKGGNMQGILAPVTLTHPGSSGDIQLILDDSNDPVAQNVTMGVSNGFGTVAGLAPATISYKAADVEFVTIKGGSGGNSFTVADTVVNTRSDFLGTTVDSGNGDDTVNVLGTTGALKIDTQGSFDGDAVNVGNAGNARGILGPLSVQSSQGIFSLEVNDSADKAPETVTVTGSTIAGLTPATITYSSNDGLINLGMRLDGGVGSDAFNIQGMPKALTVNAGLGNDTINVGSLTNSLNGLSGNLQFVGGGTNTLNVNDQGTTTPQTYLINRGFIERESGALFINFDASIKNVTVNGGSGGNSYFVTDTSPTAVTTLNTGFGADTVNVTATSGALTVNGQSGADHVRVGQGGSARGVNGAVNVTNLGSFSQLVVDDSLDHTGRVVTMNVANGVGTIAGLAPVMISYTAGDVSALTVLGGDGGNTFIVANTASNGDSPVTGIFTGAGKNSVTVQGTSGALVVTGQGGPDLVDVGGGSVQNIKGKVVVGNIGGVSMLVVDNSTDTTNHVVTMGIAGGFGSITGLTSPTAPITYGVNEVSQVQVLGGNGSNKYTINDTVSNKSNPTTFIRGGTANDIFNVVGSTGALSIDGGGGNFDQVNVTNNGSAHGINGTLSLADTGGKIVLDVDANQDTSGRTVQVTNNSIIGFTVGQIFYNPAAISFAELSPGSGGYNWFIRSTAAGSSIQIDSSNGPNTFNVGSPANTLDGIQGGLLLLGGGNDTLNINDQGSTTPHVYTQTADTLSRDGTATITFFDMTTMNVHKGVVLGSAPQAKNLKVTQAKGSRTVTLTGQLTDANPAAKLTLTVDWGDDSQPQTTKPGQSPFSLKHKYAKKGTYTIRVVWTDLKTGESNGEDLRLTVA
jgi:hypothetical protein